MNKFTQTFVVPVAAISFFVGSANAKQIFDTPQDFHPEHEMTDQIGFVNIVRQQDGGVQNYVLRTGNLESTATFDGSNLVVNQGSTSYSYERVVALDSPDGQYLGFHNHALNKTIRFPIAGSGRIQVDGGHNNWMWSQMTVTVVASPIVIAHEHVHEQIDQLALQIQEQSRQLAQETALHYQHTPEYQHMAADTTELRRDSAHLHELAHGHGSIDHMAADLAELDASFHHLEEVFDQVEANAAQGFGHVHGHTSHVKEILNSLESNIHEIQQLVASMQSHVVLRPTFGQFSHVDELAAQLESMSNEFLLDLHYNYSHNPGFRETYSEVYQVLTVAKFIHAAEHNQDRAAIQQKLRGLDQLVHHVQDDVRNWSSIHHHQIGQLGMFDKLEGIAKTLHHLMDDVGVALSTKAPVPQGSNGQLNIAPPPGIN